MAQVFQGFRLKEPVKPQVGLEAKRPTNPQVRDVYVAEDTGNIYYCKMPGKWEGRGRIVARDKDAIAMRQALVTSELKKAEDGKRDTRILSRPG